MRALIGLVAFLSAPAIAQGVVVSGPSDVAAALAAAQAAQAAQQQAAAAQAQAASAAAAASNVATKSDLQALQATIPAPMLSVPPVEQPAGSAGTAGTYRTGNAVQPRITRMVLGQTTGADGTKAVTWTPVLPSVPGVIPIPHVLAGATLPPFCFPIDGTATVSGVTVKCFSAQSVTVSILGATIAPITAASAGIVFDVLAIPAS